LKVEALVVYTVHIVYTCIVSGGLYVQMRLLCVTCVFRAKEINRLRHRLKSRVLQRKTKRSVFQIILACYISCIIIN